MNISLYCAGDVWDQYALELPRPEVVTLPFCLNSEVLLNEIQCEEMKKNALKQQQRLRDISSDVFTDHLAHPITAGMCDSCNRTLNFIAAAKRF